MIVTADELVQRRALIPSHPDLAGADAHLAADLARVLEKPLYVPEQKALLSRWGAHCRDDEAELEFDPFSPHAHRCSKCSRVWNTEQTHRWWIYWYQLWLAERVLMMALRSGSGGDSAAENRALETLEAVCGRYLTWPNADNVLGPGRPFFSTYLESIWVLHLATAAATLESLGRLPRGLGQDLRSKLFRPSADAIADFDEGRSNRQVWNAAALFALGRVLDDKALADRAANGSSGIIASLEAGVLADGLWYEGENYHWFALRGLTWGAELLRQANVVDLWQDGGDAGTRFRAAFRAPVLTALPDFTFPARRDSKFGVSLRQRRMAELWEIDLARGGERGTGNGDDVEGRASLLAHIYEASIPERDESWREITDVERAAPPGGVRREHLGWKAWLWMASELPPAPKDAWRPGSVHLEATGLAILRRDDASTYVSLDYGEPGGGHGHPDRLNLTAVIRNVPWLLDFGTGSYVSPSLSWYRMTLAHNAPLVDGISQAEAHGTCIAFDDRGDYGWMCAALPDNSAFHDSMIQRTIVVAPGYTLDVLQMQGFEEKHQLALPWHGLGVLRADEHGLLFTRPEGALRVHLSARQPFQVMVQRAPGPPSLTGGAAEMDFAAVIGTGKEITLAACLDGADAVSALECEGDFYIVRLKDGTVHTHQPTDDGWTIETNSGDTVTLEGVRDANETVAAAAPPEPPFTHNIRRPLLLETAGQFRRAEDAWPGKDAFSARAQVTVTDDALNVSVEVTAPDPQFRLGDAPNPEWENETPDIHSDGIQVYLDYAGFFGWLIVPDVQRQDRLRVTPVAGTDGEKEMIANGSCQPTATGYALSFDIMVPEPPEEFGFDLYVNRMTADRERRSGQLVWSGARGSRLYLAGDRALPGPLPRINVG